MIASGSGQVTSTPARDHESGPHTRRRQHGIGLVSVAGFTAALLAVEAANGFSTSHLTSPVISMDRPDQPAASASLTEANGVRDQAAAWVASEVSAGAIVSCDPVMCAVLGRHGFPAANLLVLGPGAPDPLGSGVVLATSAVRSMFGSRLATVCGRPNSPPRRRPRRPCSPSSAPSARPTSRPGRACPEGC
jgi:hypothetical protein